MRQAAACLRTARLAALQLQLLPLNIQLLNLPAAALDAALARLPTLQHVSSHTSPPPSTQTTPHHRRVL